MLWPREMPLTAVPQELVEQIVVHAAADGWPQAVAALAQTCSHFYQLLGIRSNNRHLWHALFLAVFEDPCMLEGSHDWKYRFINRMRAARHLRTWSSFNADPDKYRSEQQDSLLESLRTLVAAITTENSAMSSNFSAISDVLDLDNALLFGAPLSDTRLAYPLVIILHALETHRKTRGTPPSSTSQETWGPRLLESIRSSTSAWAERVLRQGYPTGLVDRLRLFDPWIYRRPRRRRAIKSKQQSGPPSIADDPDWELTEPGRLFYKLVYMKGPLLDSNQVDVKRCKTQMRVVARRRVYDMRYLTKQRLYGPFLPVNRPLSYGILPLTTSIPENEETKGKGKESLPSSSSSSEEDEADHSAQIHLDMLTLLSAGIHPHFLLHHHLLHHDPDLVSDLPDEDAPGPMQAQQDRPQFNPEEISPHKIFPDYAFLSAAKFLIEMNMKGAWGSLVNIAHDMGGADGEEDDDEDGDAEYNDEGGDDDAENDEEDEENEYEDEEEAGIHVSVALDDNEASFTMTSSSHVHIEISQEEEDNDEEGGEGEWEEGGEEEEDQDPTYYLTPDQLTSSLRNTRRWVEGLVDSFSWLDFVRMGGATGYWKDGIKERWEALRARRGEHAPKSEDGMKKGKGKGVATSADEEGVIDGWDWAGVEGEWRRVVCWMDYQDLLRAFNPSISTSPD